MTTRPTPQDAYWFQRSARFQFRRCLLLQEVTAGGRYRFDTTGTTYVTAGGGIMNRSVHP